MLQSPKILIEDELFKVTNWCPGKKLLIGFANSTFQSYGECGKSNWTHAAQNGTVPQCNFNIEQWEHFESDLDRMAEMGVNSYRFSIEWSHIEPAKGFFDENIIDRYAKVFDACHKHNIEPMLTLYHYNEPLWFSQMGGFEKEENIKYFVNFCKTIFSRFHHQVKLWLTFNEPALHAFTSYMMGRFPPHQHNLRKTIVFLKNLLKAHVLTYKTLKALPGGQDAQIGIVHNPLRFVPRFWWEPLEQMVTAFCTHITYNLVLSFLKTGHYRYNHFILRTETFYDPDAPSSYDYIGLNYYGDVVIGFNTKNLFGITCFPHQEMTDMYFPIDPNAFVRAINTIAKLNKPIYITEIGIADERDNLRGKFLNLYFDIIKNKIEDGVDIRGCYLWTFADNYEWNQGYTSKFGLHDQQRKERKSLQVFKNFIKQRAMRKKKVS